MRNQIMGGRILSKALKLVGAENVGYLKFNGKVTNAAGIDVSTYAPIVWIKAQVQGVSTNAKQYLGIDLQKEVVKVYSETVINQMPRDGEADRLTIGGSVYEVMSNDGWNKPQGFSGVLLEKVQ